MDNISKEFINICREISNKGWIKGISTHANSVGLTFENEINKKPDSKYLPDFKDIEIKCSTRFSRYPIALFTMAFSGPGKNVAQKLAQKYGYHDKQFQDKKVLYKNISTCVNSLNKYSFIFDFNRRKKIYLKVYDQNGNYLEKKAYISIKALKERYNIKLHKIAIIRASKKIIDGIPYYRYYKLNLYKAKSFDIFLFLLKKGVLKAQIISRISKSGDKRGLYRDKNIVFSIEKDFINLLFDCYYEYDLDKKNSKKQAVL